MEYFDCSNNNQHTTFSGTIISPTVYSPDLIFSFICFLSFSGDTSIGTLSSPPWPFLFCLLIMGLSLVCCCFSSKRVTFTPCEISHSLTI